VDLTGSNDSGIINGAQFVFTHDEPTGTSVTEPFLRIQNTEQGYDTSGATPFEDKAGPWTHGLTFAALTTPRAGLVRAGSAITDLACLTEAMLTIAFLFFTESNGAVLQTNPRRA
jgi:hypothetical protein